MTEYKDCNEIVEVCSALSNQKRVRLLRNLAQMGGGSLREVHDQTTDITDISHRETTYTYLQQLTDAGLIEKSERDSGDIHYQVTKTDIYLQLTV